MIISNFFYFFRAVGSYCVTSKRPPYCPKSKNDNGHPWCCLNAKAQMQNLDNFQHTLEDRKSKSKKKKRRNQEIDD